jgi:hypothetical protein
VTVASEDSLTLPSRPAPGPKKYRDPMEAPLRKLTVNLLATYKEINAVSGVSARARPPLHCACVLSSRRGARGACRRGAASRPRA